MTDAQEPTVEGHQIPQAPTLPESPVPQSLAELSEPVRQELKAFLTAQIARELRAVKNEALLNTRSGQMIRDQEAEFEFQMKMARQLFASGCFSKDCANAEQAFVKVRGGAEMGIGAMDAMRQLYLVNGKLTFEGWSALARAKAMGFMVEYKDESDESVTCRIYNEKTDESYEYKAEASDPALKKSKEKGAMSFAPRQKLRWHAVNNVIRFYVPEVLGGLHVKEAIEDLGDIETQVKEVRQEKLITAGQDKKAALRKKRKTTKK